MMKFKHLPLLEEEIRDEFGEVKKLKVGTEEYKVGVDGLLALCKEKRDIESLKAEHDFKQQQLEAETEMKNKQLKNEKRCQYIKLGVEVVSIASTVGLAYWGTTTCLDFEKDGIVSTIVGRGWIQKIQNVFSKK